MMELEEKRVQIKQSVEKTSKGWQLKDNGKFNEALKFFKKAYALAQKSQDDSLERTCALNLGAAYIEVGKPAEALETLEKAESQDLERDHGYNGDVYYNYAEAYRALEKLKSAVTYYLKAFDEFKSNPDKQLDCLDKCIQLYMIRNENSKVVDAYERMIAVYKVQDNRIKQASCLCELATKQKHFGDEEAALKSASEAAEVLEKVVDADDVEPHVAGSVFNDLGLVFSQLLHYDHACVWLERALQTTSKNKYQQALILQNIGAVYKFQSQYHVAVDRFEKAAEIYAYLKNRVGQGQCFYNMAFAYIELGCAEEADVAFNHALQAAKDCGDTTTRWQALEGLGDNKFNQANYEKAQEFYFDALAVIPVTKQDVRDRVQMKVQMVIEETAVRGGRSFREMRRSQRPLSTYSPRQQVPANTPPISPQSTYPPRQQMSDDESLNDTRALHNRYVDVMKEKEENEDQTLVPDDSNNKGVHDIRNKQGEFEEQKTETEDDGTTDDKIGQGPSTSKTSGKGKKKKTSFAPDTSGKKIQTAS